MTTPRNQGVRKGSLAWERSIDPVGCDKEYGGRGGKPLSKGRATRGSSEGGSGGGKDMSEDMSGYSKEFTKKLKKREAAVRKETKKLRVEVALKLLEAVELLAAVWRGVYGEKRLKRRGGRP